MTIIFAASGKGGVILGSDTLLTLNDTEIENPQTLPTLAYRIDTGGDMPKHLSGLCTKVIRLSPAYTLLWSGSPLIARALGEHIRSLLIRGSYNNLNDALQTSSLNETELAEIDLLAVRCYGSKVIFETHGHIRHEMRNGIEFFVGGSGEWKFFDEETPNPSSKTVNDLNSIQQLTIEIFSRISRVIELEGLAPENIHFGAWFDLLMLSPIGFITFDHAIRVWTWEKDILYYNEPILFSYHVGHNIYISSVYNNKVTRFHVPNALDRKIKNDPPKNGQHFPLVQLHLLKDRDDGRTYVDQLAGNSDALSIFFKDNLTSIGNADGYANWIKENIYKMKNDEPFDHYTGQTDMP